MLAPKQDLKRNIQVLSIHSHGKAPESLLLILAGLIIKEMPSHSDRGYPNLTSVATGTTFIPLGKEGKGHLGGESYLLEVPTRAEVGGFQRFSPCWPRKRQSPCAWHLAISMKVTSEADTWAEPLKCETTPQRGWCCGTAY